MTQSDQSVPVSSGGTKKKSWVKKALIGVGVGAVVLLVGGYILVPVIAESKAPLIIEEAAGKQIAGSVKVKGVKIGWGGPVLLKGFELRDPEGKVVGTFDVESSLGIWKVIGGLKDFGTAKVSGRLDIVRTADASGRATTNLERALASKAQSSKGGGGSGGGGSALPDIDVTVELTGIDATYVEKDASGAEIGHAAMKQLKGPLVLSTTGATTVKANLAADFAQTLEGAATGSLKIDAKVDGLVQGRQLTPGRATVDASATAKGAPVNLLDALAAQGGLLSGALGPTADATVKVKGPLNALDADVVIAAPNATADLAIKTEGEGNASRLRATRKGMVSLRSLAFVEKMPGVAAGLTGAGITVSQWPGATVSIDSLDIPAGGGNWTGAKAEVSAQTTGEVRGTVVRPGPNGQPGSPEPLVVRQVSLGVMAKDLVRGVDVIGFTSATIGGQSAGELDLNVQVSELIGPDGKLLLAGGSLPGRIAGKLEARSVATGLLAPFVTSSGLPLDLPADVGQTVDLVLNAATKGGGAGGGAIPPTDITLNVRSANVTASSALLYDATGLGIPQGAEPTRVAVQRSAPLLQRLLNKGVKADELAASASGTGRVELVVSALRIPVSGKTLDTDLASATATVTVSDLDVRTAGAHPLNVGAERLGLSVAVAPQAASPIGIDGRLRLDGEPMDVKGELKVGGLLQPQDLPHLAGLQTRRVAGTLAVTGASGRSLQSLALGAGASEPLKRIVSELVGSRVDLRVDLGEKTNGPTQPVSLVASGQGLNASVRGELKNEALELTQLEGSSTLTDSLARAALELAGQKGEAVAQAHLREATGVNLKVQPLTVPLKAGEFAPNWPAARSIVTLTAGLTRPAIVDGLRVDGRTVSAGVANFAVDASVPLTVLDSSPSRAPNSTGLRLNASMDVVGNAPDDVLAKLRATGGSGADGSAPRINVTLSDVATARLDEITGQGGLLPGVLGDKATIVAVVDTKDPNQTEVGIDVDSPQMSVKNGRFLLTKESYRASGPFSVNITASPELIERRVLGVKPGEAGGVRVGESVRVTLNVAALALSAGGADSAGGPLKPGVFTVDAVASAPKLVLIQSPAPQGTTPRGAAGAAEPARTSELNDITVAVKSTGNASKTGLTFTATVGSLKSHGSSAAEPTAVRGTIDNIADVGGRIQTDAAVLNLKATTGKLPTAIVESLVGGSGRLTELLGDELTADIEARDVSKTGASGFVSMKLKSPNASMIAGGPVSGGVMDTGAPGATPVHVELSDFRFKGGGELMKIFPIFAQVQRAVSETANKTPATIVSRGLKLPIDGDMSKLSGALDIDIGRVDYQFSEALGTLLDETIFRGGRGQDQRAIPKFAVNIDRGVVRYGSVQEKVLLPVRNLDFQMRGTVDLVNRRLDVVTYVPTIAAAPGLVANLNQTIGGAVGRLVPGVVEKITSAPIRTSGPMDHPSTGYAPEIVLDEFRDALNPGNLLKGIGDILGGGNKPAPKPSTSPTPSQGPGPSQPAPSQPAPSQPVSPRAPNKKP